MLHFQKKKKKDVPNFAGSQRAKTTLQLCTVKGQHLHIVKGVPSDKIVARFSQTLQLCPCQNSERTRQAIWAMSHDE